MIILFYFNQAKESDLDEINENISSFVKQNYTNVDFVMNIVFDSYHTFISAYDIYHYYTFIVQVKLQGAAHQTSLKFSIILQLKL